MAASIKYYSAIGVYLIKLRKLIKRVIGSGYVHDKNHWETEYTEWARLKHRESSSGPGSTLEATDVLRQELPELFRKYGIKRLLDIPCGDFNWMIHVVGDEFEYTGADIAENLILRNNSEYRSPNVRFIVHDLLADPLSDSYDLVFVRDLMVHFTPRDCMVFLSNICDSQSRYLMMTTFPLTDNNHNMIRDWFPYNFQLPPFVLPPPLEIINEHCPEKEHPDSVNRFKAIALWKIDDIRTCLNISDIRSTRVELT
jgi:hypothetical protein